MRHFVASIAAFACFAAVVVPAAAEEARGTLGLAIEIDGDGFFLNPTLKSVTVKSVTKPSPADGAGIAVKDQIVEADGHVIVGAKGRDLEPLLKKTVGQSVRLKLKRPSGEEYSVVLVAVARAAKP